MGNKHDSLDNESGFNENIDLANATAEQIDELINNGIQEHKKVLMRYKVPQERSLKNSLLAFTKAELEDVKYNINISVPSSAKKEVIVDKMAPACLEFVKRWLPSIISDQKALLDHIVDCGGIIDDVQQFDGRTDFLRGVGIVFCGSDNGTMKWFMADEVLEAYKAVNGPVLTDIARVNDEIVRLTNGLLYYYGVLDYDRLYDVLKPLMDDSDFNFSAMMQVLLNAANWDVGFSLNEHDVFSPLANDPEKLQAEIAQKILIPYKNLSYEQVYEAGDPNFINSTPAFQLLSQYFMSHTDMDVLEAADVAGGLEVLIQNGHSVQDAMGYFQFSGIEIDSDAVIGELMELYSNFNNTLPQWVLKGNTPDEVNSMGLAPAGSHDGTIRRVENKIGRNEPCPCGSGKKYKNCCMRKN